MSNEFAAVNVHAWIVERRRAVAEEEGGTVLRWLLDGVGSLLGSRRGKQPAKADA